MKHPAVLISLVSEFVALLVVFNIDVDRAAVMTSVTTICSVLVAMGILSNPDTEKKGFSDDIKFCKNCQKDSVHIKVGDEWRCKDCGALLENEPVEDLKTEPAENLEKEEEKISQVE